MKRIIATVLLVLTISTPALAEPWTKPTKNWSEMTPQERREAVALLAKEILARPEMRAAMETAARQMREDARQMREDRIKFWKQYP